MTNGEIKPIEFASSIVAIDLETVVIGLFDGDPHACVAILKCDADAARDLARRLRRVVDVAGSA